MLLIYFTMQNVVDKVLSIKAVVMARNLFVSEQCI